jgi:hypothetical protein
MKAPLLCGVNVLRMHIWYTVTKLVYLGSDKYMENEEDQDYIEEDEDNSDFEYERYKAFAMSTDEWWEAYPDLDYGQDE